MTFAITRALGLDDSRTAAALPKYSEPAGRGRLSAIAVKDGQATLIDDSYNASPASMKSAFAKTQEVWEALGKKGRKIAALGDMLELGHQEAGFHAQLAEDLQKHDFYLVHSSGARTKYLHEALPKAMRGEHVADPLELAHVLSKQLSGGDVLLIKGSHGSHMYKLAEHYLRLEGTKHAV
jgi:UDP-N-acetylmuramoyl-tripeptide--D-alanyl-D-alanine ligase